MELPLSAPANADPRAVSSTASHASAWALTYSLVVLREEVGTAVDKLVFHGAVMVMGRGVFLKNKLRQL